VLSSTQTGSVLNQSEIVDPPRYIGGNLHVSRRLSSIQSNWDLRAEIGANYWRMLVPSVNYGIQSLAGPSVKLALYRVVPMARRWGGYVKLARPGSGLGFDLKNGRELWFGVDYQLNPSTTGTNYLIQLDVSDTTFESRSVDRAMSLFSVSAGLSVQF
jgi:hypothetical protein